MRKAKLIRCAALVLCLCFVLTGCSTLGSNSNMYLTQMSQKIGVWKESTELLANGPAEDSGAEADDREALASPSNWTVSETGDFSFDAVENAGYYIVYLYDKQSDSDSFAYVSPNIENDGSSSFSGTLSDLFDYCYGLYSAEVVAYPAVGDRSVKKSQSAQCDFSVIGEVVEPQIAYLWDCFTGTLGIQLINIEEYNASSFPTSVQVTFTNQADASDVITLGFENASILEERFYDSTQEVKVDATYAISAELSWNADIVTNNTLSVDLGTVTTAANKNAMIDGYGYLNNTIYQSLDYPMVVTDFDPVVGGSAGVWRFFITAFTTNKGVAIPSTYVDCLNFQGEKGSMGGEYHDGEDVEFLVTPAETTPGSAYTYALTVTGPRDVVSLFDGFFYNDMPNATGVLELYEDGTFLMSIGAKLPGAVEEEPAQEADDGPGGGMGFRRAVSNSSIGGLWVDNGDGTLTLSYDHTSATLN